VLASSDQDSQGPAPDGFYGVLFDVDSWRDFVDAVSNYYWNRLLDDTSSDDFDPIDAKAETAVLALHEEVVEAVESAAEQLVRTSLRGHQRSISKLPDPKKVNSEAVRRETRTPELTDLVLGDTRVVPECWPTPEVSTA
jgi:type III restriction enzyme